MVIVDLDSRRSQIRSELRGRRRQLGLAEQRHAARALASNVVRSRWFRTSRRIALYMPNDGEIDPLVILDHHAARDKQIYLPVLSRMIHDRLWFARFEPGDKLHRNRFGIAEPVVAAHDRVRARALDLVLMPLVAFDSHGHRLGMGGGFYDRSLAFRTGMMHWHKPHLVGLAHDFQRVPTLVAQPWDVPMTAIITDGGVYLA